MPKNPSLRLAVFDCDGTLVDSLHGIVAAVEAASAVIGIAPPARAGVRRIVGLSLGEGIMRLFPDLGADAHAELTLRYKEAFAAMRRDTDLPEPLYPGILDLLDRLGRENYLLGVATGKSLRGLQATLSRHGLEDRFVTLQTADFGPGKPHPAMLERAMAESGAAPEQTVMIGDTSFDMEMARGAGAFAVGVGWGYHELEDLESSGAHHVVMECESIPAALDGFFAGRD